MAGATLACALSENPALSIIVLEAQPTIETPVKAAYHHRVSAIALSSQRIFQSLHVWKSIEAERVSPFKRIVVWEAAGHGEIEFDSRDIAAPVLGHIIENTVIQSALLQRARACPRLEWIAPVKLLSHQIEDSHVTLIADNGHQYQARLVVAADGARSWVRQAAGIDVEVRDYAQIAIVATVTTALPHQQTARQCFQEVGPLAFLPLQDAHQASIVWSLPAELAQDMLALDDTTFCDALARAFSHRLGDVQAVSERHAFPLRYQQAKQYIKPRFALIGDAAHTIHPLAGQGINMGLLDAAALAEVIHDALSRGHDVADYQCLRRYERWRKADNLMMQSGVDFIKHFFASTYQPARLARTRGLNWVNQSRWLKNQFMRHAVGQRGGLPVLAR